MPASTSSVHRSSVPSSASSTSSSFSLQYLIVALHHHDSSRPYKTRVPLPRITGLSTTFDAILKMALLRARQDGQAVSEGARLVCEVDGIECSSKSTPEQYGMEFGESIKVKVGYAFSNTY